MILDGPAYIAVITSRKPWHVVSAHCNHIEMPGFGVFQRRYHLPVVHGAYASGKE